MKICVAQTRPVKGDIEKNIEDDKKLIQQAVSAGADIIIFPELSITGYEPDLAKELATRQDDDRFNIFQEISNTKNITIGIGMPIQADGGILIGMIIFSPGKPRQNYYKQYLHEDEFPFFIGGQLQALHLEKENKISLAICYELSVPEHAEKAYKNGAKIYIASVAKTVSGVEKAVITLAGIAKKYSMVVLMSNCAGYCDNFECGGKTSAWNDKGELVGQLDDRTEGVLIFDTVTQELIGNNGRRILKAGKTG